MSRRDMLVLPCIFLLSLYQYIHMYTWTFMCNSSIYKSFEAISDSINFLIFQFEDTEVSLFSF